MPAYYMLHDPELFLDRIVPAMSISWQRRSFKPCVELCQSLLPQAEDYCKRYFLKREEMLVYSVSLTMPFGRELWNLLAGELLLITARDIPTIPDGADSLCGLTSAEHPLPTDREQLNDMQKACYGAMDIAFGNKLFRPALAGWNPLSECKRLARHLDTVKLDASHQSYLSHQLQSVEDLEDEIAVARECLAALRELYAEANRKDWIVLVERT